MQENVWPVLAVGEGLEALPSHLPSHIISSSLLAGIPARAHPSIPLLIDAILRDNLVVSLWRAGQEVTREIEQRIVTVLKRMK